MISAVPHGCVSRVEGGEVDPSIANILISLYLRASVRI